MWKKWQKYNIYILYKNVRGLRVYYQIIIHYSYKSIKSKFEIFYHHIDGLIQLLLFFIILFYILFVIINKVSLIWLVKYRNILFFLLKIFFKIGNIIYILIINLHKFLIIFILNAYSTEIISQKFLTGNMINPL